MKNTFNEFIEKCKNIRSLIQQNRKIKYAVIAGLVGVVIIILGVFTALGMKESADIPSDVTAGPAISEYDNVTVIQIGDDDESNTDTEGETSVDPDESVSDSESAEDDTDETEASSDDEAGEGTEDTESVHGDNEDTTVNDDPTPAGTSNTDSAATNDPTNTQSTTKPV